MRAALLRVPLLLLLLATVGGAFAALTYTDRLLNSGVTWGVDQTPIPETAVGPMGINLFLEKEADPDQVKRTFRVVRDGGFTMLRQGFPWNDIEITAKGDFMDRRHDPPRSAWDKYDYIVDQAVANHIEIVARLDAPPDWARKFPVSHSPPARNQDFADFVTAIVSRYRGKVRYFQIWNEPNLEGEWAKYIDPQQQIGKRYPDAAEYTALLKMAYAAAHAANPDARVLMAPLAQTVAPAPENLSDLLYLQAMYDAGAQPYFDIASVMGYGLATPPEDRRAEPPRINFSRVILSRAIMERNGDADKAVWASEVGWMSLPPDWAEDPLNQPGIWGNLPADAQARYLVDSFRRARAEWPWMGPMFVWHLRDPAPQAHQPQPYFGILNADWSPRPAYRLLQGYARRFPIADTGASTPVHPAFAFTGGWDKDASGAVYTATTPASMGTLTFQGSAVDLIASGPGAMAVQLDGAPPMGWPGDGNGWGTIPVTMPADAVSWGVTPAYGWPVPPGGMALRVPVARGLAVTRHTLTVRPAGEGARPLVLRGFVVGREPTQQGLLFAGYLLLGALGLWLGTRS
ncbi:MAG TPA: hypothetical protein VM536_13585, partial [Chloroflexia bacterium]|nr:hypothetical protein [Chloroflexia bacterium]